MTDQCISARDLKPGQRVYDNRHFSCLERWPCIVRTEPISAGRVAVYTTGRFFVASASDSLLVRGDTV